MNIVSAFSDDDALIVIEADMSVPNPYVDDATVEYIADHYQQPNEYGKDPWTCHQCRAWPWKVDIVSLFLLRLYMCVWRLIS